VDGKTENEAELSQNGGFSETRSRQGWEWFWKAFVAAEKREDRKHP
jgi:hypothetical protein